MKLPLAGLRSDQGGFTLVEVMLSIAISVLLIVPVSMWLVLAMRQQGPTASRFTESAQARIANTYLSRDVGSAELIRVGSFGGAPTGCGAIAGDTVLLQLADDIDDGTEVPVRTVYVTNSEDGVTSVFRRTCRLNDPTVLEDSVRILEDVVPSGSQAPQFTCAEGGDECLQVTFTATLAEGGEVNVRAMRRSTLDASFLGTGGNLAPRARIIKVSQGGSRPKYTVVLDSASSSDPDGTIQTRTWDVTGGAYTKTDGPSLTQVTIEFADIATYQVSLTVDDGTDTATARINIDVVNQAPVASLVVLGGEDAAEGAIQGEGNEHRFRFDASGSHDVDDPEPLTYQWDFGPGVDTGSSITTGPTPEIEYLAGTTPLGNREVVVTVRDTHGAQAVERVGIRLLEPDGTPPAPTGGVLVTTDGEGDDGYLVSTTGKLPRAGTVGAGRPDVKVTFATQLTSGFTWELRRGATVVATSTDSTFQHDFGPADAGDWSIALVPDSGTPEPPYEFRLNAAPVASFAAGPIGTAPTTVDFDASGSTDDGSIVFYEWNFGFFDNWTGGGVNRSNLFTHPGAYSVVLTVTDDDGAKAFRTQTAAVPGTLVAPAVGSFAGNTYSWNPVPGAEKYRVRVQVSGGSSCNSPAPYEINISQSPSFATAYPGCVVTASHAVQVSGTWGPYSSPVTRP